MFSMDSISYTDENTVQDHVDVDRDNKGTHGMHEKEKIGYLKNKTCMLTGSRAPGLAQFG